MFRTFSTGSERPASAAIIPVRPTASPSEAPVTHPAAGLLRRTLGVSHPSRRTLGVSLP
jgi:hypothetical protein